MQDTSASSHIPTRMELAEFLERVLQGSDDRLEWQRLMVTHYRDPVMEEARRECVRLVISVDGRVSELEEAGRMRLRGLIRGLRRANERARREV